MSARILLIEDDPAILELVSFHLERDGYQVILASDGREAIQAYNRHHPDLVIVDLMLPEIDGFEVSRRIRKVSQVPIIMLTAKGDEQSRLRGFELGADDYVPKPFSPKELSARVKAVLRRSKGDDEDLLVAGNLSLDRKRRRLLVSGNEIELTPKEFDLLALLMTHRGEPLDREQILEDVWGYAFVGNTRTLDVHIRRLRQKIGDDPHRPKFIETVHGVGYRFKDDLTIAESPDESPAAPSDSNSTDRPNGDPDEVGNAGA